MYSFDSPIKRNKALDSSKDQKKTHWKHEQWIQSTQASSSSLMDDKPKPIPVSPFRVLDAPQFRDDFYCSLLSYCHTENLLAVALRHKVFLWSESAGVINFEKELNIGRSVHVTSVSFSSAQGGLSVIAISRSNGLVFIRSVKEKRERFRIELPYAVTCVSFKPVPVNHKPGQGLQIGHEQLLVGDELGNVFLYAILWDKSKTPGHSGAKLLAKICIHQQQVCGLAWSPCGNFFATGANDSLCLLFEIQDVLKRPEERPSDLFISSEAVARYVPHPSPAGNSDELVRNFQPALSTSRGSQSRSHETEIHHTSRKLSSPPQVYTPSRVTCIPGSKALLLGPGRQKHALNHTAAVKAIAFCPWQRGLVATGGGTNDRTIRFWHFWSGACLATIFVHAQVTSLIWSTTKREIAVTFGYPQPEHAYRIAVFSWPDCRQIVSIPWPHTQHRSLHAIAYPSGPNDRVRENSERGGEGEGGVWYSRTREEGCIVVASSDSSIKFHEVWSESKQGGKSITSARGREGLLGGSRILEGLEDPDVELSIQVDQAIR